MDRSRGNKVHGHRSTSFVDHLVAMFIAFALPLTGFIWLLQPTVPERTNDTDTWNSDALSVHWVTVARTPEQAPPPQARIVDTPAPVDMPLADPTFVIPDEPSARNMPSGSAESPVGLPVDSGGSVYDPSKMSASYVSASTFLLSSAAIGTDSPASAIPVVMADLPPRSPPALRGLKKIEMKVALEIDASGRVTSAQLISGSGDADVDAAVLDAARTWLFEPARASGDAVASRLELDVAMEQADDDENPS